MASMDYNILSLHGNQFKLSHPYCGQKRWTHGGIRSPYVVLYCLRDKGVSNIYNILNN